FNVGTAEHHTVLEIAQTIRQLMGNPKASPIEFIGDRPGQVFRHTCDASKAERVIGWQPQMGLEAGLERTIRWYQDNRAWWQPQMWMRHIPIITASGKRELH